MQTNIKIALIKLLESNVFKVDSVIDHMLDKQVRQLLCKNESGKDLLGQITEEFSLQEYIRGNIGSQMEIRNIVTSLREILFKRIREWIPDGTAHLQTSKPRVLKTIRP